MTAEFAPVVTRQPPPPNPTWLEFCVWVAVAALLVIAAVRGRIP